jgi:hypothetical protein
MSHSSEWIRTAYSVRRVEARSLESLLKQADFGGKGNGIVAYQMQQMFGRALP